LSDEEFAYGFVEPGTRRTLRIGIMAAAREDR